MAPKKAVRSTKTLVAGGNGVLGSNLLNLLGPDKAIAVTRQNRHDHKTFSEIDIDDLDCVGKFAETGARILINAAGRSVGSIDELTVANVEFPKRLMKIAKSAGIRRFIHISSFSVYGFNSMIDIHTKECPKTDYGRSKLTADRLLLNSADSNFDVVCLRLPMLFDGANPGLIKKLLAFYKTFNFVPLVKDSPMRSMLTYGDAARVIKIISDTEIHFGIKLAASPDLFGFERLAKLIESETHSPVKRLVIPKFAQPLFKMIPSFNRRVFEASILDDSSNFAKTIPDLKGLEMSLRVAVRAALLKGKIL
ncbi:NAD-dependent epimerase/dehydratase family protein [Nostoc sp. CHAB 5834]|nr:NAD-dependent epimerase/dehydratase family protein [Nostoc sp. CHAB 5834]